jgi:MerR family redox-sensitive transcriptional activator SoxR
MADDLTIGELSARSGVAPSALRFYEERGLIRADRTSGNQRRYPRATLRRVALVRAGAAAGIPLEQIRAALESLPSGRTPSRRDWERLSRSWRADIDSRISMLEALLHRLRLPLDRPLQPAQPGRRGGSVRRRRPLPPARQPARGHVAFWV